MFKLSLTDAPGVIPWGTPPARGVLRGVKPRK